MPKLIMIMIICGTYGHRENGTIKAKHAGDVFAVDESEAERLVDLGVAEYVEADADSGDKSPPDTSGDVELTNAEIKAKLDDLGVEYPERANKAKLLELLAEADAEGDGEDSGDESPPDIGGDE
jgi:hypothetical protein